MPSIPVCGFVVKSMDKILHIVLVLVQLTKGLVLTPVILNLFVAEDETKTLTMAI